MAKHFNVMKQRLQMSDTMLEGLIHVQKQFKEL